MLIKFNKINKILKIRNHLNLKLLLLLIIIINPTVLHSKDKIEEYKNSYSRNNFRENKFKSNKMISELKWEPIPKIKTFSDKPKWQSLKDKDYLLLLKSFQNKDSTDEPELN